MSLGEIRSKYVIDIEARTDESRKRFRGMLSEVSEGSKQAAVDMDSLGNKILAMGTVANIAAGGVLKLFDLVVQGAQQAVAAVARLAAGLAQMAVKFVAQGVEINATLETMKVAFVNITGSEEAALAIMDSLRKRAQLLGQSVEQVTKFGRGVLPFAENVEQFDKLLDIGQQLAALDPLAGFRLAGRAVKEALTGNVRSLQQTFELPIRALNELKVELNETGDMDVFLTGISDLIAASGAAATDFEALAETLRGKVAILGATMQDFQKIMGAPILQEFTSGLAALGEVVDENSDTLKKAALEIGIFIAALVRGLVKTFQTIVENFDLIQDRGLSAVRGLAVVLDQLLGPALMRISQLVDGLNQILEALGKQTIDIELPTSFSDFLENVESGGGTFLTDLFPDFEDTRSELRDQFSGLLDDAEESTDEWGNNNRDFQEEDADEWLEYMREIRDIFERNNDQIIQQQERHTDKLAQIDKRANDKRAKAFERFADKRDDIEQDFNKRSRDVNERFAEKIADIERDIQKQRQKIEKDSVTDIETIERNHTKTLERLRERQKRQLFDAVNARDARRVFEIMQESMQGTREATKERNENIQEVKRERVERLEELRQGVAERRKLAEEERQQSLFKLRRDLQEKLAENKVWLNKELEQIRVNREQAIIEEEAANTKRLQKLQQALNKRLQLLARKWAEEGKLNQEALQGIIRQAEEVFGPSGAYMQLMNGFLSGLNQRASAARSIIGSIGSAGQTIGGVSVQQAASLTPARRQPTAQEQRVSTAGSRPRTRADALAEQQANLARFSRVQEGLRFIRAQHGFEGVVRKPTAFMAGEPQGNPEAVSIQPLRKGGGANSMDVNLSISSDGSIRPQLEEMISSKVAQIVGGAVRGRKRSRRG